MKEGHDDMIAGIQGKNLAKCKNGTEACMVNRRGNANFSLSKAPMAFPKQKEVIMSSVAQRKPKNKLQGPSESITLSISFSICIKFNLG